jgi:hypothetical protein
VAAIADAHGGHVSIIGTPGGGATFSVELPIEPEPESRPWGAKEVSAEESMLNGADPSDSGPFAG